MLHLYMGSRPTTANCVQVRYGTFWYPAAPYSSMEESPGRGSRIRETRHWIDGSISREEGADVIDYH